VRSSHENWNGSGYPDGIGGEEIPLASRIVRACNAFVALTSQRPYRDAISVEEALEELERCAGTDFDPNVVRVLVARVRAEREAERAA
jgi:HD-GYP domain-containing protein (c-di-GMP phosphodiesterase class II)